MYWRNSTANRQSPPEPLGTRCLSQAELHLETWFEGVLLIDITLTRIFHRYATIILNTMIIIRNNGILKSTLCPRQRYAVFGKISAAILYDSPVTVATAML